MAVTTHGIDEIDKLSTRCNRFYTSQVRVTHQDWQITCKNCLKTFDAPPRNPLPEIRARLDRWHDGHKELFGFPLVTELYRDAVAMLKMLEKQ